jgi:D-sedoheptulose 7-phosphate isomerase
LESAIRASGIPAAETVFIGDAATDLACARAAGVTPWLVRTGKGKDTEDRLRRGEITDIEDLDIRIFDDLIEAGNAVVLEEEPKKGEGMRKFKDIAQEHQLVLEAAMDAAETAFAAVREICFQTLRNGGRILVCGNGGSAADAQHFAAELVGRFERERNAYAAIALSTDTSIITALANDYGIERIFSRQVQALGRPGDVLVAISTSGNSPNVLEAALAAREKGMKVAAMTGEGGGRLGPLADVLLAVPSKRTARVQEIHEMFLHGLAESLELLLHDMEKSGKGS